MATATYTGKLTDFAEAPFPDAEPSLTVRPKHDGFGPQGLLSTRRIPVTVASNGTFSFELTPSASVLPPQSYILRCDWLGGFGYSEWEFEARAGGGNIKDMGVIDQMGLWREAAAGVLPPLVEAAMQPVIGVLVPPMIDDALHLVGLAHLDVDDQYSDADISYDFRRLGGVLAAEQVNVGWGLPGYTTPTVLGSGVGEVSLTFDFRRVQPGGNSEPDGLTPQWVLDEWSERMGVGAFNSLTGIGDSMTTNQGGGLSQTLALAAELGVQGFDLGGKGDTPYQIGFRYGALPLRITVPGGVIPATGATAVTLTGIDTDAGWWHARDWRCTIRSRDGQLVPVIMHLPESSGRGGPIGAVTIEREFSGAAVPVIPGTRIRHQDSEAFNARMAPALVWLGRNDWNAGRVIEALTAVKANHRDPSRRMIILPIFNRLNAGVGSTDYIEVMAVNAAIAAAFPDEFFDARAALINHGLGAVGVSPTPEDTAAITDDRVPPSLALDPGVDITHLNDLGRQALAIILATEISGRNW